MSDFRALIKAVLDRTNFDKEIADIGKKTITLKKFTLDPAALSSAIENAKVKTKLKLEHFDINEANLDKRIAATNIKSAVKIKHFVLDTSTLPNEIQASIDKHKFKISLDGIKLNNIASGSGGIGKFSQNLAERVQRELNDTLKIEADISKVEASYKKLASTGHKQLGQLKTDLEDLRQAKRFMGDSDTQFIQTGDEKHLRNMVDYYKEYLTILQRARNEVSKIESDKTQFVDTAAVDDLISQMEKWASSSTSATERQRSSVKNLSGELTKLKGVGQITIAQFDAISDKFDNIAQSATNATATLASNIRQQISTNGFDSKIDVLTKRVNDLSNYKEFSKLSTALEKVEVSFAAIDATASDATIVEQFNAAKLAVFELESALRSAKASTDKLANATAKAKLDAELSTWLDKNPRAVKAFGTEIKNLQTRFASFNATGEMTETQLKEISEEFQRLKANAQKAGVAGSTFGTMLASSIGKVVKVVGGSALFNRLENVIKDIAENVIAIDTAMTELYRVTDLTDSQYENLYKKMIKSSKEYGIQLDSIITSTADWSKLGFDPSVAQELANITAMYQHVTDLDIDIAVDNLVTAFKGFEQQLLALTNGDVAAAVEYIADIYNQLGKRLPMRNCIG